MLLKLKQVAAELQVAVKTVRAMIRRGELPGIWMGRSWRVDDADLAAFVQARWV